MYSLIKDKRMDYVLQMQNSANSAYVAFLSMLQKYKNDETTIYGYVEGEEDITFYQHLIDPLLPEDMEIIINKVGYLEVKGGKAKVVGIYNSVDWSLYSKNRILFFVDRDLSSIINDATPTDVNIYVTDHYSIENHTATSRVLIRLLEEIYGLDILKPERLAEIGERFNNQKENFCTEMSEIMANIIFWKNSGVDRPQYNNINIDKLLSIDNNLEVKHKLSEVDFIKAIYNQSKVDLATHYNTNEIATLKNEFISSNNHLYFTRGKYMTWYLKEFIRSLSQNLIVLGYLNADTKYKQKQIDGSKFLKDALVRCKVPVSLKYFIELHLSQTQV